MDTCYQLDRPEKGLALIINNLHNKQKATRNDVSNLEAMFKKIGVQVPFSPTSSTTVTKMLDRFLKRTNFFGLISCKTFAKTVLRSTKSKSTKTRVI